MQEGFLTARQVAKALDVCYATVRLWIAKGRLPKPDLIIHAKLHAWNYATIKPYLDTVKKLRTRT